MKNLAVATATLSMSTHSPIKTWECECECGGGIVYAREAERLLLVIVGDPERVAVFPSEETVEALLVKMRPILISPGEMGRFQMAIRAAWADLPVVN